MANVLFIEEQKFRHNLLWSCSLLVPLIAMVGILLYQNITGELVGDHPMSNLSALIILICYGLPSLAIIFYTRLTTIITDETISYGWNVPTQDLNEVKISAIKSCEVIEYKFVGWGYRISRLYGTVYNVDGNKGLQIITHSGEKILIGTHHAEELKKVILKMIVEKK